jgi:hypothetical protein
VGLLRTNISEEHVTYIFRLEGMSELGTVLSVTSRLDTSQKMAFFIATIVKTSNLI